MTISNKFIRTIILIVVIALFSVTGAQSYPISFYDSSNQEIQVAKKPVRVICLVPGITDMITAIGAEDSLIGVTYHDVQNIKNEGIATIGGYFSPSVHRIIELAPDVIFYSDFHKDLIKNFPDSAIQINLETRSVSDIYRHIDLLGKVFEKSSEADQVIRRISGQIAHIQKKVGLIPDSQKKRVIRLMGIRNGEVMTPGDDSFQHDYIRLAGGISPKLNKPGASVPISLDEWKRFNPEIIYDCGKKRDLEDYLSKKDGWKDADALKNGRIYYFSCDYTCRASIHAGDFIAELASTLYTEQFCDRTRRVFPDHEVQSHLISEPLDHTVSARIIESMINDFVHRTLIVEFKAPMRILSTLEGFRSGIRFVGNSYSPPPTWGLYHYIGLEESKKQVYHALKLDQKEVSLLFTGADMNHLAISRKSYKDMSVTALATAGVGTNALRMSKDIGSYYEPGTINIILIPSMKLTERAMSRAVISATEAKTAVMQDLDIRSAYTGIRHSATGTGTDNIIIAEGSGQIIDNAGGHTKMGELIAAAVYEAVKDAIKKQNNIFPGRSLFSRLFERGIDLYGLLMEASECCQNRQAGVGVLEDILLTPQYEGFLEMAFAVSDAYEQGLIRDLSSFKSFCDRTASELAGGTPLSDFQISGLKQDTPLVIRLALEAIVKGVMSRIAHE